LKDLSDLMVCTFINQRIATSAMLKEAEYRLLSADRDDSELCHGQLHEAVNRATSN
jgi:hypothetical protein